MTAVTVSGCPLETLGGMATTLYHQYTEGISLVLPVFLGFYLFLVGSLGSFNPSLYLASFSVSVSVSLSDPAVGDVGPALSTHRVLIAVLTSSTPWLWTWVHLVDLLHFANQWPEARGDVSTSRRRCRPSSHRLLAPLDGLDDAIEESSIHPLLSNTWTIIKRLYFKSRLLNHIVKGQDIVAKDQKEKQT